MERQAIVALLGKSDVFGALAPSDRDAIASHMRPAHFEPGQMIFSRGDPARETYLVLEGRVRLSVLTNDGRELSFAHAGPGIIFGEKQIAPLLARGDKQRLMRIAVVSS